MDRSRHLHPSSEHYGGNGGKPSSSCSSQTMARLDLMVARLSIARFLSKNTRQHPRAFFKHVNIASNRFSNPNPATIYGRGKIFSPSSPPYARGHAFVKHLAICFCFGPSSTRRAVTPSPLAHDASAQRQCHPISNAIRHVSTA